MFAHVLEMLHAVLGPIEQRLQLPYGRVVYDVLSEAAGFLVPVHHSVLGRRVLHRCYYTPVRWNGLQV